MWIKNREHFKERFDAQRIIRALNDVGCETCDELINDIINECQKTYAIAGDYIDVEAIQDAIEVTLCSEKWNRGADAAKYIYTREKRDTLRDNIRLCSKFRN